MNDKEINPGPDEVPGPAKPQPGESYDVAPEIAPPAEQMQPDAGPEETAPAAAPPAVEPQPPADEASAAAEREDQERRADETVLAASRKHTRRSFVIAGASAAAGYGFYQWLEKSRVEGDQPVLLRKAYEVNAALSRGIFHERALAPTYPLSKAETLRTNGVVGLSKQLDPASWRLQVVGAANAAQQPGYVQDVTAWEYRYQQPMPADGKADTTKTMAPEGESTGAKLPKGPMRFGRPLRGMAEAGESASTVPAGTPGLLLTMDAIRTLPRHEFVTQFKCIEGWSQYVHWAGVRLRDFIEQYPPEKVNGREPRYLYMETPDGDYYTSYNMLACRHPQSLLVTEMMGAPLVPLHGAPLRLHMPIKYGYKQIKRIGLIRYMDTRPDDYWTHLGYDWYAGI